MTKMNTQDLGEKIVKELKSIFDPEILTYLNDSLREEIVETLDIRQLANLSLIHI